MDDGGVKTIDLDLSLQIWLTVVAEIVDMDRTTSNLRSLSSVNQQRSVVLDV